MNYDTIKEEFEFEYNKQGAQLRQKIFNSNKINQKE